MEKVRKLFVILFSSLSLFFAIAAIHNHYYEKKHLHSSKNFLAWNDNLPASAKDANKLIFVAVNGTKIPVKIRKILDKHYSLSVLDTKENYADFQVLDYFLKTHSHTKNNVICAVFTPEIKPVYVMSKIDERKLVKILPALAKIYAQNQKQLTNNVENLLHRHHKTNAIFADFYVHNASEKFALLTAIAGRYDNSTPLAILTENARIAFQKHKVAPTLHSRSLAQIHLQHLKNRFAYEKKQLEKMLIARAISDIAFATNLENISELKSIADTIANNSEISKYPAENALALSILSRAFSIYDNEKYLQKATEISEILKSKINTSTNSQNWTLPNSDIKTLEKQNLNAFDLATIANALCDYAKATNDKYSVIAAFYAIKKLDSHFISNGVWTLNSRNSLTANFARIAILDDIHLPSYVGEAYQAIAKIKTELGMQQVSRVENNIAKLGNTFMPLENLSRASIKLAKFF